MGLLTGKTALITGGSRGIGEALVKAMAAEGADIAFTYHSSEESAMRVVTEASAGGQKIKAYSLRSQSKVRIQSNETRHEDHAQTTSWIYHQYELRRWSIR